MFTDSLGRLIKHDQHAYQEDLEEGFRGLKEGIAPYLDSAAVDAARKYAAACHENVLFANSVCFA